MKVSRVSAALLTFGALSLLAACGGGGGGGGVNPPPGGGGGGGGGATSSPSPTPSPVVTSSPTPTVGTNTSLTLSAEENFVNGNQSWYTAGTASWSNNAGGTSAAPTAPTDGTTCVATQEPAASQSTFSQHIFVGILNNGTEEALPQALGMQGEQPPTTPYPGNTSGHPNDNYPVEIETCENQVHTHDYSGLVHIEDVTLAQSNTSMPSYANLQTLFDLWGAQLSATGITAGSSTLSGPVTLYVGTPSPSGNLLVNSYAPFTGAANTLAFSKHMVIWIVVGTPPSAGLPQVKFVIEN